MGSTEIMLINYLEPEFVRLRVLFRDGFTFIHKTYIWYDVDLLWSKSSLYIVIPNHEIVKTARILLFSIDEHTIYLRIGASCMIKKVG